MEPMEWVALGSAVLGGVSAISGAMQQSAQADSEAKAAEYNAQVQRQNADNALLAASANEDAKRRENAQRMGAQRAALIESGVDITSGTGADLVQQSDINSELDALNIRYQGQLQANGDRNQAGLDDYQASAARSRGSQAWINGGLGVVSSALSGVGNYYRAGRLYGNNGLTSS